MDDKIELQFVAIDGSAELPSYKHDGDACMDVRAVEGAILQPFERKTIRTGLACNTPKGYELQVRPRSGMASKDGVVAVFGTVDSGYRGEIGVTLMNLDKCPHIVEKGDRIAQLMLSPVTKVLPLWGELKIGEDGRGSAGFGSTGVK